MEITRISDVIYGNGPDDEHGMSDTDKVRILATFIYDHSPNTYKFIGFAHHMPMLNVGDTWKGETVASFLVDVKFLERIQKQWPEQAYFRRCGSGWYIFSL